jgi:hypothetical protein
MGTVYLPNMAYLLMTPISSMLTCKKMQPTTGCRIQFWIGKLLIATGETLKQANVHITSFSSAGNGSMMGYGVTTKTAQKEDMEMGVPLVDGNMVEIEQLSVTKANAPQAAAMPFRTNATARRSGMGG